MIAGHLQEKKGLYYMVLSYKDKSGKRISKWLPTGLPVKGNKKRAEDMLMAARAEFVAGEAAIDRDMPFSSYLVQWMEIARSTLKPNTAAGYASMIQNPIAPYFQQRGITLGGLQAVDIQMFYTSQLKRVSANTVIHYHAIIHRALKYAVKTDLIDVNPADKVERPRKDRFNVIFQLRQLLAHIGDIILQRFTALLKHSFQRAVLHLLKLLAHSFQFFYGLGQPVFQFSNMGNHFSKILAAGGRVLFQDGQQFLHILIFHKKLFVPSLHSSGVLLSPGSFPRQSYLRFPARIHKSASASGPCRRDGQRPLSKGAPWKG